MKQGIWKKICICMYTYNHIMGTKIEQCCGSFFIILHLQHFLSLFLMQWSLCFKLFFFFLTRKVVQLPIAILLPPLHLLTRFMGLFFAIGFHSCWYTVATRHRNIRFWREKYSIIYIFYNPHYHHLSSFFFMLVNPPPQAHILFLILLLQRSQAAACLPLFMHIK